MPMQYYNYIILVANSFNKICNNFFYIKLYFNDKNFNNKILIIFNDKIFNSF